MDNLDKIRQEIDRLDKKLIEIMASRMALMPNVAKYKQEHDLPLFQPEREKMILSRKTMEAKDLGLSEQFLNELFTVIFSESKKIQERTIENG